MWHTYEIREKEWSRFENDLFFHGAVKVDVFKQQARQFTRRLFSNDALKNEKARSV